MTAQNGPHANGQNSGWDPDCEFCHGTGIWSRYEYYCAPETSTDARRFSVWTESACPAGCEIDAAAVLRRMDRMKQERDGNG